MREKNKNNTKINNAQANACPSLVWSACARACAALVLVSSRVPFPQVSEHGPCLDGRLFSRRAGLAVARVPDETGALSCLRLRTSTLSSCAWRWCTCCVLVLGQGPGWSQDWLGTVLIASPQSRISIGAAGELSASSLGHPIHPSFTDLSPGQKTLPNNTNTNANANNCQQLPQPATRRNATSPCLHLSPSRSLSLSRHPAYDKSLPGQHDQGFIRPPARGWAGPLAHTQSSTAAYVWPVIPGHGNFGECRGFGSVPAPSSAVLRAHGLSTCRS
ncbi:hypothetical protein J3F84DRAFT_292570 [Trichoderma pleuroticola]